MIATRDPLNHYTTIYLCFSFLGGCILLFIVTPLASLLIASSTPEILAAAVEPEVQSSIILTLWTALCATGVCSIAAIPFAWIIARKDFWGKSIVSGLIDLPVVIPHSAAGIALIGFFSPKTPVGSAAEALGIRFIGGTPGVIAAMAFVSVPFVVNAARDGFAAVPVKLERAALSLGASPLRVFFTISLPLASRSILSGMILMWARGMSEFGSVAILAYQPMVASVLIYERFGAYGLRYARPIAILLLAICLFFFTIVRFLSKTKIDVAR